MDISSAIDWWDEWKLRMLVLCSLCVYCFLPFSIYVRPYYALRRLRVLVWIAYIGGDALTIYALATLFNHSKQQQTPADGGGDYAIEVIWAPFLLILLGGQITASAYSLEDNELWKRHVITLVSQATVAIYVFCKWWSGKTRLLLAAIFLFIVGILKFSHKPWALRRASYANITSTLSSRRQKKLSVNPFCTGDLFNLTAESKDELKNLNKCNSLEEYVKQAQKLIKEAPQKKTDHVPISMDMLKVFVDLAAPYSARLNYMESFLGLDKKALHENLQDWIAGQFVTIYTRARSSVNFFGCYTFLLVAILNIISVVLFATSNKDNYSKSDITVTYILYFGTGVMELATVFIVITLPGIFCTCHFLTRWEEMVAQHNIMSSCARRKKTPTLILKLHPSCSKLWDFITQFTQPLWDYIDMHWYIKHQFKSKEISELVLQHAEDGWKGYICDTAGYTRFNNLRGEHTLVKMKHHLLDQDKLGWTFSRPFDEYVLLWHITTDLCLHHTSGSTNHTATQASSSQTQDTIKNYRSNSEVISNYMIYLLLICPDMLKPGTRSELFMDACDYIWDLVKFELPPSSSSLDKTKEGIAKLILDSDQIPLLILDRDQGDPCLESISGAHRLATFLIGCLNEEERWEVIQGVWVEMLCYSASRCRGYLHVKSLGVAAEFLTYVWLLWWSCGMQTLPDMIENLASPEEEQPRQQTPAASV